MVVNCVLAARKILTSCEGAAEGDGGISSRQNVSRSVQKIFE